MSSATLEEKAEQESRTITLAERAAEAVASEVIASPEALPFDRVSRQRLLVAQTAADTIERLAETGAWERLEPKLAEHLLVQARRLEGYVTTLTEARPVRSSEPALLLLRRLQRRISIAVELVEDEAASEGQGAGGGLFLGDFTEVAPETSPDKAKAKAKKKESARTVITRTATGKLRWATKAEKLQALRQSKRVMAYITIGVVAVVGSLVARAITTMQERPPRIVPPPVQFAPNEYLKDVQGFVPATGSAMRDNDLTVVVTRDWLLRPYEQRSLDANGLAVYLLNRNIRRVRLQWEDGRPIVQFENGAPTWFDEKNTVNGHSVPIK